jgi:hypothetical protein
VLVVIICLNKTMSAKQGNIFEQDRPTADAARAELTDEAAAKRAEQAAAQAQTAASNEARMEAVEDEKDARVSEAAEGQGWDRGRAVRDHEAIERERTRAAFAEARRKLEDVKGKYPDVNT